MSILERGEGRERERERNIDMRQKHRSVAMTRVRTHNLGMCPDWELNLNLLVYQTTLQPSESHGPVLQFILSIITSLTALYTMW